METLFLWLFSMPQVLASGNGKLTGADVITIVSVVVNILMSVFVILLNRKWAAERELRKAEQDKVSAGVEKAKEAAEVIKKHLEVLLDQLRRDIDTAMSQISECADADTVAEVKQDVKELQRDMLTHQNRCPDRFVQRTAYSEDQRAQRETISIIREMIQQQNAIIEKMRSSS